ncbi:hypothetical protein NMY22_g17597 [Coprinellus aureogranulatus]|nr:hypothetical protein NMY22_g17597 [Coprinellus aureogranulatus]
MNGFSHQTVENQFMALGECILAKADPVDVRVHDPTDPFSTRYPKAHGRPAEPTQLHRTPPRSPRGPLLMRGRTGKARPSKDGPRGLVRQGAMSSIPIAVSPNPFVDAGTAPPISRGLKRANSSSINPTTSSPPRAPGPKRQRYLSPMALASRKARVSSPSPAYSSLSSALGSPSYPGGFYGAISVPSLDFFTANSGDTDVEDNNSSSSGRHSAFHSPDQSNIIGQEEGGGLTRRGTADSLVEGIEQGKLSCDTRGGRGSKSA